MILIAVTPSEITGTQLRISRSYMNALTQAGAVPVLLPLTFDETLEDRVLDMCSGILFTGGNDLDPALYGEEKRPSCGEMEPERDGFELRLFEKARERKMPILAICRGIQLVNVAMGGTLYQDLQDQRLDTIEHRRHDKPAEGVHHVNIREGSRLYEAVGCENIRVNSRHHQAIKDLAPGLRVCAAAPDGLTEGVEGEGDAWLLGVQWHPESMVGHSPEARRIFSAFVAQCERFGTEKNT